MYAYKWMIHGEALFTACLKHVQQGYFTAYMSQLAIHLPRLTSGKIVTDVFELHIMYMYIYSLTQSNTTQPRLHKQVIITLTYAGMLVEAYTSFIIIIIIYMKWQFLVTCNLGTVYFAHAIKRLTHKTLSTVS